MVPKKSPILTDLDPSYRSAWSVISAFKREVARTPGSAPAHLAIERPDGSCFHHTINLLPHTSGYRFRNEQIVERSLKFLLWMKGGSRIHFNGPKELANYLSATYSPKGERGFDNHFLGRRVFREPFQIIHHETRDTLPCVNSTESKLGGHLEGCRIGFDLGGSDRKTSAVIDGEVVFSEEIPWDPYFQEDPNYHLEGIRHSLESAAKHLPRVDAIGGSAAGVYIDNEVRAASLFRGVTDQKVFDEQVRPIFKNLRKEWNNVPFDVINDGEVTALAAALSLKSDSILGIAMGTSQAAGYCNPSGNITPWLNELAFAPIDLRSDAPVDEWSGDHGCGVQYFSQQAVARLAPAAGFDFGDMSYPLQLVEVQKAMKEGHPGAHSIFQTIGGYLGHTIPLYAHFYELKHLLLLGRVLSGDGGQVIIDTATGILANEYPDLGEKISLSTPDEKLKRHGQAIAAASLPSL